MSNLNPGGLTRVLNYIKTWVTGLLNDKANSSHSHTKSQITDFPTLATVATSGSYNDLSNKPTIPTVNNATLTIQKNGTTVKTFTANASSNVTANITVPTKTSELTNDSGFITSSGSCNYANSAGAVAWDNVSGKPSTFTPSSHTHDDRYYTESEINTKLSSKSDTSHNHNSTYLGISAKAESAKVADYAKLLAYSYGNEINFKGGRHATCYFNYRNADDDSTGTAATVEYAFCNYGGSVSNVTVSAGTFNENGSSLADKYQAKGSYASSSHTHTKSQITDFPSIPSKTSDLTNDMNFLHPGSGIKAVRGTSISTGGSGYWAAMCNSNDAGSPTLPTTNQWWHVLSMDWSGSTTDVTNWCSQLAIATQDSTGLYWRRNDQYDTSINNSTWHKVIDDTNIGSQSVNYANSAGSAPANGGTSTATAYMNQYDTITYGVHRLQYYNTYTSATSGAGNIANPYTDWFYHLLMSHADGNGYYGDIALCFHSNTLAFRRIVAGGDSGWCYIVKNGRTIVSGYEVYVG